MTTITLRIGPSTEVGWARARTEPDELSGGAIFCTYQLWPRVSREFGWSPAACRMGLLALYFLANRLASLRGAKRRGALSATRAPARRFG